MKTSSLNVTGTRATLISALATLLLLLGAAIVAVSSLGPPPVVAATAPADQFSAERALVHVEAIAQTSRAMGTDTHTAAREYIVAQLETLELTPEVQEQPAVGRIPTVAGTIRNILARIPGSGGVADNAILLVAHYDSVADGPGASDDASNVALLLETARALIEGTPLVQDVIILVTDGEETGLLGANAFVQFHPWAQDVGLVLNFEARGHYGPSLMFETSQNNNWLIQDLAPALPHPQTSSLFYEVYQMLPNDTDFSVFKRAGMSGFNFAFMNGVTHYHARIDDIANLDPRSLQAQGDNGLALTRAAGTNGIPESATTNAVFFSLLGSTLFRYTSDLVVPLAVIALIVWGAVAFDSVRRKQATWRSIGLGVGVLLLTMVATFAVTALVWVVIGFIYPAYGDSPSGDIYNSNYYAVGFVALTFALGSLLYGWFFQRSSAVGLALGALLLWLLLTLLTSFVLPGGSYIFLFPLLFGVLGVWLWVRFPTLATHSWGGGVLVLTALPAVLLFAPTVSLLFMALTISQVALVCTIVALSVGLVALQLSQWAALPRWWLPTAFAIVTVVCFIGGGLTSGFSPAQPRPTSLFYTMDPEAGTAHWVSSNRTLDDWTSQYLPNATRNTLPDFLPRTSDMYWQADAPVATLMPPEITVLERTTEGDTETLHLNVRSQRDAPVLLISTDASARVVSAEVEGQSLISTANLLPTGANPGWGFRYYAPPTDGIDLTVTIQADSPYVMQVVDLTIGLPELNGESLPPMPDDMMPAPYSYANLTLVRKAYTFNPAP